jgi:TfoX/Sxy family transcriptional regulator of competence genes
VATNPSIVGYLVEQMAGAGTVSARKMFGEYGVYCDGKMIALICNDQLFVKPSKAGRRHVGEVTEAPPYKGAKPCFLIPAERWDDREWLSRLVQVSAAELPSPAKTSKAKHD